MVNAVAVAPDGTWLATAGRDQTVRIWDAGTGQQRAVLTGQGGAAPGCDNQPSLVLGLHAGPGTRVADPVTRKLTEKARTASTRRRRLPSCRYAKDAPERQSTAGRAGISNSSRPKDGLSAAPRKIKRKDPERQDSRSGWVRRQGLEPEPAD